MAGPCWRRETVALAGDYEAASGELLDLVFGAVGHSGLNQL